jgi:hypothetical protein
MRGFLFILTGLCFLVAVVWVGMVTNAEHVCPLGSPTACNGPGQGDIWMGPFIYAVVGLPAVIISIIIIVALSVRALLQWRRTR